MKPEKYLNFNGNLYTFGNDNKSRKPAITKMKKPLSFIEKLGFKQSGKYYIKTYPQHDNYEIKIDIKAGKIFYRNDGLTTIERRKDGKIQLGDTTSSHFKPGQDVNTQESLVVLEAVDALLEKGYEPQDIHIERRWKVGHGASGGKSDINIYKNDKTFIIIECKTAGKEFEKEKKRMLTNGGQLFTYLNEDANARYLVLYASYIEEDDDEIIRENLIVKIIDNPDKVKLCKEKDKEAVCSYKEARNKDEFFQVWKNLYDAYFYRYGIFEEDVNAYSVELKPLKKKDLKPLNTSKGLFNRFAEILRHNNISDNANAFNKMLSLILCKIVDESEKRDDDVLDFQIIEGLPNEKIIDKFQRLYKDGMAKYLGIKDFVYHSDEEIESRIKDFPKRTPLEEILQFFKDIKYYTDKTFAFKEIYNKKLFEENAAILKEVVELLQFYKFKNTRKNQILGDFFELLLNHGVKQSEGQFFTPLPVAKFMVLATDFESLQAEKEQIDKDYPMLKTLDYACGAGHFLIEAIDKQEEINRKKNLGLDVDIWTKQYIFGIEKDYRLARTAKIACFLNGDGEANIIYGDGLKKYPELDEDYQKFDVILTNPPYSVKQFKNYVDANPDDYELFNFISEKASEIEVLFIERAKQALRYGGRIAIILPSSILSNTGIYTKAREIILKYFELKAITELGNKTFIATGTNTVVLFLQRRDNKYPIDYQRVANELFDDYRFYDNDYIKSRELLKAFIDYRQLPDYHDFLKNNTISNDLEKTEIFETYKDWFYDTTQVKNIRKKKFFKDKTPEEQEKYLFEKYLEAVKQIEKEKFYYFLLTYSQKTIIVKSPTATAEQKAFLGYEFNKKRGFEGIEIYTDTNGKPTTKLYDPDGDNPQKADYYIRKAFRNQYPQIDEQTKSFVKTLLLTDMLDFEKISFEKMINTNAEQKIKIESKWPLVKLKKVSELLQGLTYEKNFQVNEPTKNKILTSSNIDIETNELNFEKVIYLDEKYHIDNTFLLRKGDIFIATSSGSITHLGKNVFISKDLDYYFGGFCAVLRSGNYTLQKYISTLLHLWKPYKIYVKQFKGQNINNLKISELERFKIPLPPPEIQEQIVSEIESIEKQELIKKNLIREKEKSIQNIIHNLFTNNFTNNKLGEIAIIQSGGTPSTKIKEYWENGTINWLRSEVCQNCYVFENQVSAKITELGLENSNAKLFPPNTILVALVGATLGKVGYLTFESSTNQNIAGLYRLKNYIPKILFYTLMNHSVLKNYGKGDFKMLSISKLREIKIPVPPLPEQEKIAAEITALEHTINQAKQELENLNNAKKQVLDKYLI